MSRFEKKNMKRYARDTYDKLYRTIDHRKYSGPPLPFVRDSTTRIWPPSRIHHSKPTTFRRRLRPTQFVRNTPGAWNDKSTIDFGYNGEMPKRFD